MATNTNTNTNIFEKLREIATLTKATNQLNTKNPTPPSRFQKVILLLILSQLITATLPAQSQEQDTNSQPSTSTEIIEETDDITTEPPLHEIVIHCDEGDESKAEIIKKAINEIQNSNDWGSNLIKQITTGGVDIYLDKINNHFNAEEGSIKINSDNISEDNIERIKSILIQEMIHKLHHNLGFIADLDKLPPQEAITMRLIMELDTYIKAYMIIHYNENENDTADYYFNLFNTSVVNDYIKTIIWLNIGKEVSLTDSLSIAKITEKIINGINSIEGLPKYTEALIQRMYITIRGMLSQEDQATIAQMQQEYYKKSQQQVPTHISKGNTQ